MQGTPCLDGSSKQGSPAHSRPTWLWFAISLGIHLVVLSALPVPSLRLPEPQKREETQIVRLYEVVPVIPDPPPLQPEPIREPVQEPELEAVAEPEPNPVPEPEPEPKPEPEPEPEPEPNPVPEPEPDPEPAPVPKPQLVVELVPEAMPELEPEPMLEPEPEPTPVRMSEINFNSEKQVVELEPVSEPEDISEDLRPVPENTTEYRVEQVNDTVIPPQILTQAEPLYPVRARKRGWTGEVSLVVFVSALGQPSQVRIVTGSGHAILDEAAVEAVSRWSFIPAQEGDQKVDGELPVIVKFTLE